MKTRAVIPPLAATLCLVAACSSSPEQQADPSAAPTSTATTPAPSSTTSTTSAPAPTSVAPTSASPATPTGSTPQPVGFASRPVGAGRLLVTDLAGQASGVTMKVWVWLPPQYDDPAYATTKFPVLMLYPGGDGANYTQWFTFGQPELIAERSKAGTMSPFILVEPQMQLTPKLDTECTDLEGQPKVGTFMQQDVPDLILRSFRVLPQRTGWGIGGASSGGYCAARLLFAQPDRYAVGATLAGYFLIDSPLPGGKTAAAKATSPQVIAAQNPPDVTLRNWVASTDPVAKSAYDNFAKVVKAPTKVDQVVKGGGGHTWTAFKSWMPEYFEFFSERLDKPSKG